jgi:hypothetical protein
MQRNCFSCFFTLERTRKKDWGGRLENGNGHGRRRDGVEGVVASGQSVSRWGQQGVAVVEAAAGTEHGPLYVGQADEAMPSQL